MSPRSIWEQLAYAEEQLHAPGMEQRVRKLKAQIRAMALDPLVRHYREAARRSLMHAPGRPGSQTPADLSLYAADGAVLADRTRMAEQLRNRILTGSVDPLIPPNIAMVLDAAMLTLADQIEQGMPLEIT